MSRPLVIGLTGGIGCGKSAVMRVLAGLGAEGIDADRVAHAVMAPGGPAYAGVVAEFGPGILAPDGAVDRSLLGQRVFADPAALARLEAIVHPAVAGVIRQRVEASAAPVVVIEAIKLLEAGLSRALCDQVWIVACTPETQVARLAATRGMAAAEVERRRANQMPQADMIAQAARVIRTDGTLAEMAAQVLAAWAETVPGLPAVAAREAGPGDAAGMAAVLNEVVKQGGLTVLEGPFTPEREAAFLAELPPRGHVTVATLGGVVAGLQTITPFADYTRAMDHVATLGTYVLPALWGRGIGQALAAATFACAHGEGYRKIVINVRADNPGAQAFYLRLGFRPCGRYHDQAFVDGRYIDELLYEMFLGGADESTS